MMMMMKMYEVLTNLSLLIVQTDNSPDVVAAVVVVVGVIVFDQFVDIAVEIHHQSRMKVEID